MTRRPPLRPSAFSLIEILIAVTVLALGLLGLGMVFPVVVRQQRQAQDSIQGLSAARSADAYLSGRGVRRDVLDIYGAVRYSVENAPLAEMLTKITYAWHAPNRDKDGKLSGFGADRHSITGTTHNYDGQWLTGSNGQNSIKVTEVYDADPSHPFVTTRTLDAGVQLDPVTGKVTLTYSETIRYTGTDAPKSKDYADDRFSPHRETAEFQVADRLTPTPFAGEAQPLFVWDFALRAAGPNKVDVAVFARRIDAGIRIPTGGGGQVKAYTLAHILTGEPNVPEQYLRSPVAVDRNGRPTLTGLDRLGARSYALPRAIAPLAPDAKDPATLLRLSAADTNLLDLVRQPGQKLVDYAGVVHTVVRASDVRNGVILDKPLSELDRSLLAKGAVQVQYLFTPQVPAAVSVFSLQQ